mmetsp:Transcript_146488/g.255495  ORF Transcript_146488/g.255495 Transcript_146488/m.255495 type:complete len:519 (+) Transcript_146488:71-1627(+)
MDTTGWHEAVRARLSHQMQSKETVRVHRPLKVLATLLSAFGGPEPGWQLATTRHSGRALGAFRVAHPTGMATKSQEDEWEGALEEVESERLYNLGSKEAELSQFALWLQKGKLNLFPEYQREYVWKPAKASRLIATVLCNRFIPPVVLHERKKGIYDVVDGKQRLTTILGFYLNGLRDMETLAPIGDKTVREKLEKQLPNLEVLTRLDESYEKLNGLNFAALTEERKNAYESYSITYVVIPYGTPKTDVFEVYDDINSGGENLTPQQVRRAVYYGPYIEMLDNIAINCKDFHAVRDLKNMVREEYEPCHLHTDRELILRAFAFRENGDRYKMPLKKFLNEELDGTDNFEGREEKEKKRIRTYLQKQQTEFEAVMRVVNIVFGGDSFRKWSQKATTGEWAWSRQISLPLWDSQYVCLSELLREFKASHFSAAKDHIQSAMKASYENGFFSQDSSVISDRTFLARKDELKRLYRDAMLASQIAAESETTALKAALEKAKKLKKEQSVKKEKNGKQVPCPR